MWEPGRGRSSDRKLGGRERKQLSAFSQMAASVTRSSGLVSLLGCCHRFIRYSPPSPVTGTVADALETKPAYLLWFVFTCLETPGQWSSWCHSLSLRFTAESKKGLFFCHSVETYTGKEEKKKQRHTREVVTFAFEGSGLRFTPASVLGNSG